jgi:hypothetical protein
VCFSPLNSFGCFLSRKLLHVSQSGLCRKDGNALQREKRLLCFVGFTITNDDVGPLDSLLALNRQQRRNGKEKLMTIVMPKYLTKIHECSDKPKFVRKTLRRRDPMQALL